MGYFLYLLVFDVLSTSLVDTKSNSAANIEPYRSYRASHVAVLHTQVSNRNNDIRHIISVGMST